MLLTLTALVSGVYSYDYYEQVANAEAQRASAEAELARSRQSIEELRRFLKPAQPVVMAEAQLERFLNAAWVAVEKHGVTADVSVRNDRGVAGAVPVTSFFTNVPNTDIKTVRVSITGRYSSYKDFKQLLDSLQSSGGFLSGIRVKDNAFELSYQVYGG